MTEIYFNVQSDNGSITDQHALRRWSTQYMRALEDRKDLRIGSKLRNFCEEAGLVEVDAKMIPLPLSAWSSGKFPLALLRAMGIPMLMATQIPGCGTLADATEKISNNSCDRSRCILSRNVCTCRHKVLTDWWSTRRKRPEITR